MKIPAERTLLWLVLGLVSLSITLGLVWSVSEVERICRDRNHQLASVQNLLKGLAVTESGRTDLPDTAKNSRLTLFNEAYLALAPVEC